MNYLNIKKNNMAKSLFHMFEYSVDELEELYYKNNISDDVIFWVIYTKNFSCVKYLMEIAHIDLSDEYLCALAALVGDLKILKYLYKKGCPMTIITTNYAVRHFDCLKWAIDNGAPFNDTTKEEAIKYNNMDSLEYLTTNLEDSH